MSTVLRTSDGETYPDPSGADVEEVVDQVRSQPGASAILHRKDMAVKAMPNEAGSRTLAVHYDEATYRTAVGSTDAVKDLFIQVLWGDHGPDARVDRNTDYDWMPVADDASTYRPGAGDAIELLTKKNLFRVAGAWFGLTACCIVAAGVLGRTTAVFLLITSVFFTAFGFVAVLTN